MTISRYHGYSSLQMEISRHWKMMRRRHQRTATVSLCCCFHLLVLLLLLFLYTLPPTLIYFFYYHTYTCTSLQLTRSQLSPPLQHLHHSIIIYPTPICPITSQYCTTPSLQMEVYKIYDNSYFGVYTYFGNYFSLFSTTSNSLAIHLMAIYYYVPRTQESLA